MTDKTKILGDLKFRLIKRLGDELVDFRIKQAYETIPAGEFQIKNDFLNIAVNRIYYGMFYVLLALALKHNYKTSKHQQLIGWFNKEIVKTGKADMNISGQICHIYDKRFQGHPCGM